AGEFHRCNGQRIAVDVRLLGTQVCAMDRLLGPNRTGYRRFRVGTEVSHAPQLCGVTCRQRAMECNISKAITLTDPQGPVTRLTYPRRVREHSVEYRLQLAGRRADDAQHLRGCRLLLEGLPKLVKQPRVLNGDDGLRGEILHQRDLLFGEGKNFLAVEGDYAD